MITPDQLLHDMKQGALRMNQVPCTECRSKKTAGRDHFHGSDWGKCVRLVWFDTLGAKAKEERTGEDAMRLNDGHLHEALLLKAIQMGGHTITHRDQKDGEIEVTEMVQLPGGSSLEIRTLGHTDGVMDGEVVIECKAVKDWAWKNKFCKGLLPPTYYGQCQFYLHAHKKTRCFLVVKHRHTSEVMIFVIDYDIEHINRRRLQLAGIKVAVQNRLAIKVPFAAPTDECRFCEQYNQCWR